MVRFKNRYFILSVRTKDGRFHESVGPSLAAAIRSSIQLHHGEEFLETASPSLQVAYYHHITGVAIVRIGRAQHVKVLQSTLKLNLVDYKAVIVKLLKLTGVFRVAKKSAAEHIQRIMATQRLTPEHKATAAVLQEKLISLYM